MSPKRIAKVLVQGLVQSRMREHLGCKDMVVVVKWGDDDGTNWTVELTGLPAPHRCLEAAEIIATELRTKYRLEKDQFTQDELTALLLNETLAEVGPGWIPFATAAASEDQAAASQDGYAQLECTARRASGLGVHAGFYPRCGAGCRNKLSSRTREHKSDPLYHEKQPPGGRVAPGGLRCGRSRIRPF